MPHASPPPSSPPILNSRDPDAVAQAAAILRGGGIVVIPTDTVYGIAAMLDQPTALARIFTSKGRPTDRTLPILLGGPGDLSLVSPEKSDRVAELIDRFWPGPLTIVVPANPGLSPHVVAPDGTVGVRVPANLVAQEIIRRCGGALAVTSANRSGMAAAVDASGAVAALGLGVDAILDDGIVANGTASTIVRVSGQDLEIVRAGAIDSATIWAAWNR